MLAFEADLLSSLLDLYVEELSAFVSEQLCAVNVNIQQSKLRTLLAMQAAMLIAQRRCGARCWIPARFLPPRYDYFRVVLPAVLPGETELPVISLKTYVQLSNHLTCHAGRWNRHCAA